MQPVGDLLASAVVGVLYAAVSPTLAFGYVAAWMVASLVTAGLTWPRAT